MRGSANLTFQNWPHRKVKRVQILAPSGPFIFANERWNVCLNPSLSHFWIHVTERSLFEESKVRHQIAYVPRKAVPAPKCPKCFCTLSFTPEGTRTSGNLPLAVIATCHLHRNLPPSQKVDSGVGFLSCLPLIHLYSKLYHFGGLGIAERQISSYQWTPNWAPCRLSWDSECVDICQV